MFKESIRFSCHILINLEFCAKSFEKYPNMYFLQNPFIWTRVFPWERTDRQKETGTDGRTDRTKLTVAFRNSANAPKNGIKFLEVWNYWPSAKGLWSFSRCVGYFSVKFYISGFHPGISLIYIIHRCFIFYIIFKASSSFLHFYTCYRLPKKLITTSIKVKSYWECI